MTASRSISSRDLLKSYGTTQPIASSAFEKAGNLAIDFELVRRAWAVQKLSVERSAITHAFGRKLPPLLRTPPPGRMMYCISG